ncbi:MAG: hypothetical protein HWE13_05060 [Gammaproteobacteria bacterium]|nr:hypothetical protein [Gammaproteobacteria bacterium]
MSLAYEHLTAMGLTPWVLRDEYCESTTAVATEPAAAMRPADAAPRAAAPQAAERNRLANERHTPTENLAKVEHPPQTELLSTTESVIATTELTDGAKQPAEAPAHAHPPSQTEVTAPTPAQAAESLRGYLVLPSQKRWIEGELLIVCRHQAGQPAESFWLRGQPSKTLRNLVNGLSYCCEQAVSPKWLNRVNFAQLAATALSEQTQDTATVLAKVKPRAILVLGAHTANLLTDQENEMSQWQLKNWQTPEGIPFVVTYHPYEIFQSPLLKRQVYQDLQRLSHLLMDHAEHATS